MTPSPPTQHHGWRQNEPIAPGGTVLDLASAATGTIWAATTAGVWQRRDGQWHTFGPDPRPTALTVVENILLAAGVPSDIRYSYDHGQTWSTAWVDGTNCIVTCFAVSPNFARDRTLLAGTGGAGILRSTDGGRYWHLSNVGLEDFTVLAMAVAPVWTPREYAFAATDDGLYRSPNGGRAWKRADRGIEGVYIQTLVVSPSFATDSTLYAGSEDNGIYCSTDTGASWQHLPSTSALGAINGLWMIDNQPTPILIVGTGDGRLLRSLDNGVSWTVVGEYPPILAVGGYGQHVYAGLEDAGLAVSDDAGATWTQEPHFAARDITRLTAHAGRPLVAFGPTEGAWRQSDMTNTWQALPDLSELGTLFALDTTSDHWLAATEAGLFRSSDDGTSWQPSLLLPDSRISVIATCQRGEQWIGTATGALWHSDDAGDHWSDLGVVAPYQPLVALAISRPTSEEDLIVAASFDLREQRITIWRSTDARHWETWLTVSTITPRVSICLDTHPDNIWLSIGTRLWRRNSTAWQSHDLDGTHITRLLHLPETATYIAATAEGVYLTSDGEAWERLADAPRGLLDIAVRDEKAGGSKLLGLEAGGIIWERPL